MNVIVVDWGKIPCIEEKEGILGHEWDNTTKVSDGVD
jgi:hypothetical protein